MILSQSHRMRRMSVLIRFFTSALRCRNVFRKNAGGWLRPGPFLFFLGPIVLIQGASALIGPEGMTGLIYILAGAAKNLTRQNPTAPAIRRSG
jgi:hypothetical protein